jgi:type II secretory pathway component GspD/PulD (secretin)
VVQTTMANKKNTIVIKPTKEELQKHKEFLSKILSPIWL